MAAKYSGVRYNKVFVIQSLPAADRKTGWILYDDHLRPELEPRNQEAAFRDVHDKLGFWEAMGEVLKESLLREPRIYPVLHLEIHGAEDKSGLVLSNGQVVTWREFTTVCEAINRNTANNLVVTLAVCFGYTAIQSMSPGSVAPYFLLVGPTGRITAGQAENEFKRFYRTLFATGDLNQAIRGIGSTCRLMHCEHLFAKSYVHFLRDYCPAKVRREWVERAVDRFRASKPGASFTITEARRAMKLRLRPSRHHFQLARNRFLIADLPENVGRFTFTFEDAISTAHYRGPIA